MKIYEKTLYVGLVAVFFAATTTVYASTGTDIKSHDQDLSEQSFTHDSSSVLVMADAEGDSSSVSFYLCSGSDLEVEELNSSAVDVESCVSAFRSEDGKSFTVSKQSLQDIVNQDFLVEDLDQLAELYELDLNDIEVKLAATPNIFGTTVMSFAVMLGAYNMAISLGLLKNKPSHQALIVSVLASAITASTVWAFNAFFGDDSSSSRSAGSELDSLSNADDSPQGQPDPRCRYAVSPAFRLMLHCHRYRN